MFEYEVMFIFDGFTVVTTIYAEDKSKVEFVATDKLSENGLDLRRLGAYEMSFKVTAELL